MKEPAPQIQQCLIDLLRQAAIPSVDPDDIRGTLDTSGRPKGFTGCTVHAVDRGNHNGIPGRILVDVEVDIDVYSHVNEDADGSICSNAVSFIRPLLPSLSDMGNDWTLPPLENWRVRYPGNWETTGPVLSPDAAYRVYTISATLFLQNTGV